MKTQNVSRRNREIYLASTEEAPTRRSCSVQSFSYPTQNFPGFTRTPGSMTPMVKAYLVPTTTASQQALSFQRLFSQNQNRFRLRRDAALVDDNKFATLLSRKCFKR